MPLRIYRELLPHWRVEDATYFVTWRLKLGLPLLSTSERSIVRDALLFFDGVRFDLLAYVVMDDHVHLLVRPYEAFALEKLIHSWRSFTTREFHRLSGRSGRVWQHDYFDRIVRSETNLREFYDYIVSNPWKRWPGLERYEWLGLRGIEGMPRTD